MTKRVLITGAGGLLGSNLMQEWQGRYECVGTYHGQKLIGPDWNWIDVELTSDISVAQMVDYIRPDVVVHCAATANVDWCEDHPCLAFGTNTIGTQYLAWACRKHNAKLVYISTDAVFDGTKGDYSETDTPNPLNVYAKTKLAGEIASTLYRDDTLIVRTNIYGHSLDPDKPSAVDRVLATLERGEEYRAWGNVRTSPILVNDLANALHWLIEAGCSGIYHVGATHSWDRSAFYRALAYRCGYPTYRIRDDTLEHGDMAAERPKNTTLDVSKAERLLTGLLNLDYALPTINDGLRRFAAMRRGK